MASKSKRHANPSRQRGRRWSPGSPPGRGGVAAERAIPLNRSRTGRSAPQRTVGDAPRPSLHEAHVSPDDVHGRHVRVRFADRSFLVMPGAKPHPDLARVHRRRPPASSDDVWPRGDCFVGYPTAGVAARQPGSGSQIHVRGEGTAAEPQQTINSVVVRGGQELFKRCPLGPILGVQAVSPSRSSSAAAAARKPALRLGATVASIADMEGRRLRPRHAATPRAPVRDDGYRPRCERAVRRLGSTHTTDASCRSESIAS